MCVLFVILSFQFSKENGEMGGPIQLKTWLVSPYPPPNWWEKLAEPVKHFNALARLHSNELGYCKSIKHKLKIKANKTSSKHDWTPVKYQNVLYHNKTQKKLRHRNILLHVLKKFMRNNFFRRVWLGNRLPNSKWYYFLLHDVQINGRIMGTLTRFGQTHP